MPSNYIKQLKELLENLTQEELAERLSVSFPALNRWVNGHAEPHKSNLVLINKLYKELIAYPKLDNKAIKQFIQDSKALKRKQLWKQIQNNIGLQEELILEHTYNSNTIEGSTFTKRETEAVLFNNQTIKGKNLTEHLELVNHSNVLKEVLNLSYPVKVNEELIKSLHYKLMQGIREDAGKYSKHHRAIRGLDLSLCHPKDIPDEMTRLIKEFNAIKTKTLKDIAKFHVDFELIHPFGDGNGRVGRLLMVMQCLSLDLPPVIIHDVKKLIYYDTLYYAQTKQEGAFIEFIYEEMLDTNRILEGYL